MAHTPGPWAVCDGWRKEDPHGRLVTAEEYIICGMTGYYGREQTAINARLVAAAPDLLAACKAQHDAIDRLFAMLIVATKSDVPSEAGMRFMPSKSGQPWDALVAGTAAIAKATGGAS